MKTVYVGVDPSLTNTGVCVLDVTGKIVATGDSKVCLRSWNKQTSSEKASPGGQIHRLRSVADYVATLISKTEAKRAYVGYEDYSYDSTNRAFSLGELGGVLKAALLEIPGVDVTLLLYAPTQVKQFATGYGHAAKGEMRQQALVDDPDFFKDMKISEDVCDAFFLAKLAWYAGAPSEAVLNETYRSTLRKRLEIALTWK